VHYGAGVRVLDFARDPEAARGVINDWVEDVTEDKIVDLLPADSIKASTKLVLVNAIYFSAAWKHPFAKADTAPRPFTTATGTVDVKTLRQVAQLGYGTGPGFRAAFLPFDGGSLEMGIVVPDGQTLAQLEAGLDGAKVAAIQASRTGATLTLQLPVFSFRTPLSLAAVLKALGMTAAFESDADFTGILASGLKIAAVIHQAFIGIDEDGAEAAGATAVILDPPSAPVPGPPAELLVDQPFLFFIADRPTGEALFFGRVLDPRS
jgi:serpin B